MSLNQLPIMVGQSDTNGSLAQDLGQQYVVRAGTSSSSVAPTNNRLYRLVYNNSGTTLAAGAALIEQRTSGCRNGYVTTTTVLNDPNFAGVVPTEFGTGTVAAASYFLMQIGGPGKAQFATTETTMNIQTTVSRTQCSVLGTASVAGYLSLITFTGTGTDAALYNDVAYFLAAGIALTTNSTAATAAGAQGTIVLIPPRL